MPLFGVALVLAALLGGGLAFFRSRGVAKPPVIAAPTAPTAPAAPAAPRSAANLQAAQSTASTLLVSLWAAENNMRLERDVYVPPIQAGWTRVPKSPYAFYTAAGPAWRSPFKDGDEAWKATIIGFDEEAFPGEMFYATPEETGCPLTPAVPAKGQPLDHVGIDGALYLFLAAGNLDGDRDLDCWSISPINRVSADGQPIRAGTPWHEQDDLAH